MMNYNKNKLINRTLDEYYATFSHMLDTSDYVPERYNVKVGRYIFKNMKKSFRLVDREDRKFQRAWKKQQRKNELEAKRLKLKESKSQRSEADSNSKG